MEVDILLPARDPVRAILKLYDWRYSAQLREENYIAPWDSDHETALIDFIQSGGAATFLDRLRHDDDFEEPEEGWNLAENETYLYDQCLLMYRTETSVYAELRECQGNQIPRLITPITFRTVREGSSSEGSSPISNNSSTVAGAAIKGTLNSASGYDRAADATTAFADERFEIKGILLERIAGFNLGSLTEQVPQTAWQLIVDQAIQNVHILSDHHILNTDIRNSNILVVPLSPRSVDHANRSSTADDDVDTEAGTASPPFRVVMIDFAQCRFREADQSDAEWGRREWAQDEEGAIGMVVRSKLKKSTSGRFELKYDNSGRFLPWAAGEGK